MFLCIYLYLFLIWPTSFVCLLSPSLYMFCGPLCSASVVIYKALCFDVAQGRMNGASNENRTHSCKFASLAHLCLFYVFQPILSAHLCICSVVPSVLYLCLFYLFQPILSAHLCICLLSLRLTFWIADWLFLYRFTSENSNFWPPIDRT